MNFGGAAASQCSEEVSHAILDAYAAAGGNVIDCANIYQGGLSEQIVGRWLAKNKAIRHKLVVATKARNAVSPSTAGPNDVGLSRAHLTQALADSLARLQVDYIDLYQAHVWDDGTPLEETLRTLDDFVKAGKIRYYGFSNTTGWQLQKIVETAKRLGLAPCASLQQQYSLLCRHTELEVTDVCEREGVALLPWSPLKGGWLSGKLSRGGAAPEGSRVAWAQ
jgi:aryl-alcohol dehydrogenase-like predicted oxidoreductase